MKLSKNSAVLSIVIIASIVVQGCGDCINGDGNTVTQSRSLPPFTEISFATDEGTIYISQDSLTTFTVEAQQNIIDDLITEVNGNRLEIFNDHCIKSHAPIIVRITAPDIRAIGLSGTGEMITLGKIISDEFNISLSGTGDFQSRDSIIAPSMSASTSGTGDIELLAKCTSMNSEISGTGTITLNGSSVTQSIITSGAGDVHAFGFITDTTYIEISGASDVEVFVNHFLDVTISGSGNVYYKGNATVSTHISGSGNVIHTN